MKSNVDDDYSVVLLAEPHAQRKFVELIGLDGGRRLHQQILAPLGLRKRDHVAKIVEPASFITQRSKPKAKPPWGGAPISSASSMKPKLCSISSSL